MNNLALSEVDQVCDFGVVMDRNLSFGVHVGIIVQVSKYQDLKKVNFFSSFWYLPRLNMLYLFEAFIIITTLLDMDNHNKVRRGRINENDKDNRVKRFFINLLFEKHKKMSHSIKYTNFNKNYLESNAENQLWMIADCPSKFSNKRHRT